jgi:purine nucleosidase
MARKVLIDCDPGIDDAVALCLALFDPRLDVIAITATEGNASAEQTSRNAQAIIDTLDPPRYPRLGVASPLDQPKPTSAWMFHGDDGLGNSGLAVSELHQKHLSEKVICDVVRANPEEITIIALGPLTNIARALRRDPELTTMIGQLLIMGGSVNVGGNITAAAEFNVYYDPDSAREVFQSPITKTLIPLDVTRRVVCTLDFLDEMPDITTRAGKLLQRVLPFSFRAHRQRLGLEGIHLHDAVAIMAAIHPELFETHEMIGDVETRGTITTGATIFDRRENAEARPNMAVAMEVDAVAVLDGMVRGLRDAGQFG